MPGSDLQQMINDFAVWIREKDNRLKEIESILVTANQFSQDLNILSVVDDKKGLKTNDWCFVVWITKKYIKLNDRKSKDTKYQWAIVYQSDQQICTD